jgi:hypothetical protein
MLRSRRTSQAEDGRTTTSAKPRRERPSERLSLAAFVTLAGAILAALISGTNLTFELWPGLKPDPKEKVRADLEVLEMDKNVDYKEYDDRPGRNLLTISDEKEPRTDYPGNVFYLRAHIEGFKRESLRLIWFTYEPNRHRSEEAEARSDRIFEPDSPSATQVAQVWVKEPGYFDEDGFWTSAPGEYFVRFELYRGDVLLAFEDSRKFTVA